MKSLIQIANELLASAFTQAGLDPKWAQAAVSQRPDLCQYQCNGLMPAAKQAGANPRDLAARVVPILSAMEAFSQVSSAGPGFLNLTFSDAFLGQHLDDVSADPFLGCPMAERPRRVVVDFGGPNVAKPMHVGHLRSTIIGDCLQRLARFMGDEVVSDIHLGDWGLQMGMLISEYRRRFLGGKPIDEDGGFPGPKVDIDTLEEMYPAAAARCKSDEEAMNEARLETFQLQGSRGATRELWLHFVDVSKQALKRDFESLGVRFDLWKGESDYHQRIPGMLEALKTAGLARESEGALVIPLEGAETPPFILVKSDGAYLYSTTDLATLDERVRDLKAQAVWYVVDKRQSLHFQQLFEAARKSGIAGQAVLSHVAFGTMNGKDGKPFKTRAGGVMKLKDLIQMTTEEASKKMEEVGVAKEYGEGERNLVARQVGVAALKFADLSNHRLTDYIFDLEKFARFEGKTGPYLLYSAVRIKSILRKAEERSLPSGPIQAPGDLERELVLQLARLPEALWEAYQNATPNTLCEFGFELAQRFSRFYQNCHILNEEDAAKQASWLMLAQVCLKQLNLILDLLGIPVPERM